jgi:hypothetical protein
MIVRAGAAAVVLGGAGAAAAASDDSDTPITGDALRQATDAALAGGGRVTGTEVGDEDSYYQVEVTRDDASQVDVQLDDNFAVVKTMSDSESGHGTGG